MYLSELVVIMDLKWRHLTFCRSTSASALGRNQSGISGADGLSQRNNVCSNIFLFTHANLGEMKSVMLQNF